MEEWQIQQLPGEVAGEWQIPQLLGEVAGVPVTGIEDGCENKLIQ